MLFARRNSLTHSERLKRLVWPDAGWWRASRYLVLRMVRLRSSPHRIALGCSLGVFAAVTPLLGVQMLLAVALALILKASVRAAVLGTFIGNPVSWPLIWAATYAAGCALLGRDILLPAGDVERQLSTLGEAVRDASPERLDRAADALMPVLTPMLTGSLLLGLITAAISYYILKRVVAASRARRRAA